MSMESHRSDDTASWDAAQVRRSREEARPAAAGSRRRRRRRRRLNPVLAVAVYVVGVVTVSACLAGVGWLLASDLCAFGRGAEIEKVAVAVTEEDTVHTVAQKLQDAGLIRYKWFFRLFAGLTDAEEKIVPGTYTLNTDMDYHALIAGMRGGSTAVADTVKVTIPEGYTVAQTIRLLAEKDVNTEEALLKAAREEQFDFSFIDNTSKEISRLEGFLFPDTYEFYVDHDPKDALEKMIANFDRKMDEDVLAQVEASGRSLKEIVTIASLIEKETDGSDQAQIASVIYNRLADTGAHGTYGLLQIDAALLYALPPDHTGAITSEDLELDSPYNLRKHAGLPPTPIANPGMTAINAALYPVTSYDYYYALGTDHKHHYFAEYRDFVNFVNSSAYGG